MARILKERGRSVPLLIILDAKFYNTSGGLSARNLCNHWKPARDLLLWISGNIIEGWGFRGVFRRIRWVMKRTHASPRALPCKPPGATVDTVMDISALPPKPAEFTSLFIGRSCCTNPGPMTARFRSIRRGRTPRCIFRRWTGSGKIAAQIEAVYVDGTHLNILKEPQVGIAVGHLEERLVNLSGPYQTAGKPILAPTAVPTTEQSPRI